MAQLAQTFPYDWVQARYREAGFAYMNADFGPGNEGYFPAYQIARTASGALCVDPGWKYLTELGLALERLKAIDGIERLRKGLAQRSGTQHHVCMAADFLSRGMLQGLEPETGVGSTLNDLLVVNGGKHFQVELKEFSSSTPFKRLKQELDIKSGVLPAKPDHPVVFHAVLLEKSGLNPPREKEFCEAIELALGEIPKNISAIVVGRRFLDCSGGGVKRDTVQVSLIPDATTPASLADLEALFPANYQKLEYPLFGLMAPMHFGEQALILGDA